MANLSERSFPYQRTAIVSLNGSGDFAATSQNLVITRLGDVVNISADRRLDLAVGPAGEWQSAVGVVPTWARPSSTQTADGSPRNCYGSSSTDDSAQSCWVNSDGSFVIKLVKISDATNDTDTTSIVAPNITFVVG